MPNIKKSKPVAVKTAQAASEAVNKNLLLFTVSFTLFFTSYMYSSVNIALPAIGRDFTADVIKLSWVTSAIFVTSSIFMIPFGRLADIVGLKKIYMLGMILYVLTNSVCALSSSVTMLIVMRAIQGISAAMVVGNIFALISAVFPAGAKGKALGIASGAVYLGLTCSPLISGFLTTHFGWRSIFLITVPAGIIILIIILWKIKGEWHNAKGESLDLTGTAIFGVAVTALMYGFSKLPQINGWILLFSGIILLIGFIYWENRIEHPLIKVDLFKGNRIFVLSNLSAMINYSATYAVTFLMSLYLQYNKGLSPGMAGLVLGVQPITQAILSPITGKISDRVEPRIVASVGMGISCAGLAVLSILGGNLPIPVIIVILIFLGVGFALFVAPNTNAIMSSVPSKVYGVASAIMNSMRNFGQMFSMGISMMVLALIMGSVVVTKANVSQFVSSTRIAFGVFAVLCLIGVFTSFSRGKVR